MSSQRGNVKKQKAQKHQNTKAFKNNLHDTSGKAKLINSLQVTQCCARCTEVIEWKIRYKKYKPLTVPKKCTKCQGKTVKKAYCIVCEPCARASGVCMKCGAAKDVVHGPRLTEAEEAQKMAQLEQELKFLPERKRRTFLRLQESGQLSDALQDDGTAGDADDSHSEDEESDEEEQVTSSLDEACAGAAEPHSDEDGESDEEVTSSDVENRLAVSVATCHVTSDDVDADSADAEKANREQEKETKTAQSCDDETR